jgi:hypothetical protein
MSIRNYSDVDRNTLVATNGEGRVPLCLKAVSSERHIGIDQGRKNFAIVAVNSVINQVPTVLFAENNDLQLKKAFTVTDVFLALRDKSSLMSVMQPDSPSFPIVDRVVVHLEQMSIYNPAAKKFGIELGEMLQRHVEDVNSCIVKLSQPHVHRASGPAFRMGSTIVDQLQLTPASYQKVRMPLKRPADADADGSRAKKRLKLVSSASSSSDGEPVEKSQQGEYGKKKKMSAAIFRYFVEADLIQQGDLKINIDTEFQQTWKAILSTNPKVKLDDVGDALLHSLNDLLCGGSNYLHLVPPVLSLYNNRTVILAVYPLESYWAVLNCTWNTFLLENFGKYDSSKLLGMFYKGPNAVQAITALLPVDLLTALTKLDPQDSVYRTVDTIKMVVKQLKGHPDRCLDDNVAGTLTLATVNAMRALCDQSCTIDSFTSDVRDKLLGTIYTRTDRKTGDKFQVYRSTGKHTNAILGCLEWMRENVEEFVTHRPNVMSFDQVLNFFETLQQKASAGETRMEMIELSPTAMINLSTQFYSESVRRMLGDLFLIGMNQNQQVVKSIASNYRKPAFGSAASKVKPKKDKSQKKPTDDKEEELPMVLETPDNVEGAAVADFEEQSPLIDDPMTDVEPDD